MSVHVKALDQSRLQDFFALHTKSNGAGWCHCVAWWVPTWDAWSERTAAENKRLREELSDRGEFDGYLAYVDGKAVGWVQAGPRDRLEKLTTSYGLERDSAVFAVTCFLIAPAHRRMGIARSLLEGVIRDCDRQSVRELQAFPKPTKDQDPCELWTGPEELFVQNGFERIGGTDQRPVYSRTHPRKRGICV